MRQPALDATSSSLSVGSGAGKSSSSAATPPGSAKPESSHGTPAAGSIRLDVAGSSEGTVSYDDQDEAERDARSGASFASNAASTRPRGTRNPQGESRVKGTGAKQPRSRAVAARLAYEEYGNNSGNSSEGVLSSSEAPGGAEARARPGVRSPPAPAAGGVQQVVGVGVE